MKNKAKNRKNPPKNKTAPRWMLLVTIFITGNVIMMLEIVGTRIVGPYFGVGIYVWSALITVTLLALSTGYWIGGKWADAKGRPEFLFKTILTAGVFIFLIPVIRNPVLIYSGEFDVRGGVLMGSMMLFGPPLFLLGIVSPYATKLFTEQFEKLGSRVGLLYAVSTLGSFFGTINIGFYMIPNFHISTILFVLGTTLLIMPTAYAVVYKRKQYTFLVLTFIATAVLLCFFAVTSSQKQTGERKILYKTNSFYGEIKVTQQQHLRILLVDGVAQSGENYLTHEALPSYIETIRDSVRVYHPDAKNALIIGLGGGNIVHALLKDNILVDVVEIDKKIITVAEQFFSINPARIDITATDGRLFVRKCKKKYDAVVLNAYSGETFPAHMLTKEFFAEVTSILNPAGLVILNFYGYVEGPQRFAGASVYATLKYNYDWCRAFFKAPRQTPSNIVFVAGSGQTVPSRPDRSAMRRLTSHSVSIDGWESALVCSDDYNPIEFMNRIVYIQWRQAVMKHLGPDLLLH